jgi:hypothetical protein
MEMKYVNFRNRFIIYDRYAPNTKRKRISDARITQCVDFLNDRMPVASGRNYRILPCDISSLYEEYQEKVERPVGKSYFYATIANENVRRQTIPSLCPYCTDSATNAWKGSGSILLNLF